jgi:dihydrofolate synthase / folylpolyglutamate synthase
MASRLLRVRPGSAAASAAVDATLRRRLPAYTVLSPAHIRLAPSNEGSAKAAPLARLNHEDVAATYELLVQRLYQVNRFTAVKLGIENMKQLNGAFGDPASRYDVVHVAGTNGKGSVSLKVAKALERSGYKTGLFVSPHVSCFRERIQINGELISEEDVCEHLSQIFNVSAQLRIPATFFEITTMLAFQYFAKQRVDCVVLETGLGGRLDATNIVDPTVSVVTSIGMDHTRILGNSIDAIAREKAGIIKPGAPVVIGPQVPLDIIQHRANEVRAPLVRVETVGEFEDDFNVENTAIAREVCVQLNELAHEGMMKKRPLLVNLDSERVNAALSMRPPCRFQVLHIVRPNSTEKKVTIVLDVAHNLPAFQRLVRTLQKRFPTQRYRFVCGFSADKDISQVLRVMATADSSKCLEDLYSRVHLVKANHPRGASLEEINLSLENANAPCFDSISDISTGVNNAIAAARGASEDEVVVVCGSVFLMAEARQALGFKEPMDSTAINAVAGAGLSTPETRLAAAAAVSASASPSRR